MQDLALATVLLLGAGLGAGISTAPALAQQPELIHRVQRLPASSLDSTLPPIAFERWLAQVGGVARGAIQWEVNDCGEGGDGHEAPTCVEATLVLSPDISAHASLIVAGTDGAPGKPAVWLVYAIAGGSTTTLKSLPQWAAWVRRHRR